VTTISSYFMINRCISDRFLTDIRYFENASAPYEATLGLADSQSEKSKFVVVVGPIKVLPESFQGTVHSEQLFQ
jgi:hypothetical protein